MSYIQAADRLHCPPWDLIDEPTPRLFWHKVALIMIDAEGQVEQSQATKKQLQDVGAALVAKGRRA